jgi:hypothetical protein|tara:strand:- start:3902 stop:4528 length:627 start_codon:yes stop_codon:yes gene_type:complete
MAQKKSVFETLSAINVNDKVEKKSNLTYLSWAWAWAEVKKQYPDASYEVSRDPQTDKPWFFDPALGYLTMTSVTIEGETLEMWLPVMDGANNAMMDAPYTFTTRYGEKAVNKATMFDINKTIMRCLTKNLAMFGLGHYIYAGEDLPESKPEPVSLKTLKVNDDNYKNIVAYIKENNDKTIEDIVAIAERKYKLTAAVKKALTAEIEKA